MINVQVWIILAALCLLGEMITAGFFLLWFGIGALVAAAFNYLGFDPVIQFAAFIITSTVLLGVSRPFAQKISKDSPKKAAADRLIGKKAVVIKEITSGKGGLVNVDGDVWRAVASCSIKNGETVTIEKIDSIKLVVKPINEEIKGD